MNRLSEKRRQQLPDEAALKGYLIERHGGLCCWCAKAPGTDKHECGRGKYRLACLLAACAVLLLCRACHGVLTRMASDDAERLGLAILRYSRREDYHLPTYLQLTSPAAQNRITESEVDLWSDRFRLTKEYRPEFV